MEKFLIDYEGTKFQLVGTAAEAVDALWRENDRYKQRIAELKKGIARRDEDCQKLQAIRDENAELEAENQHWRKHGPILIKIIEELVDEGVDLGTIGEGTKLRIDGYITAALGVSDDR